MNQPPLISICIPAYKRIDFLKKLLDSIAAQTFTNFEVIITDDSPGDDVKDFCHQYDHQFEIKYFKNKNNLGTPENWNEAIRHATGEWIKLMHDDDWFAGINSLEEFAFAAAEHPDCSFIFSGFTLVDAAANKKEENIINEFYLQLLQKSPLALFKKNFIGHPSTTLIKKGAPIFYDKNLKWVVDIEFYIRYLLQHPQFFAIKKSLINIGLNEFQVTKEAFRNPVVEIPEGLYLLEKLPQGSLKNIFAYDYYWRFIRNLGIRNETIIKKYASSQPIPLFFKRMMQLQATFPVALLKKGVFSKSLMLLSYIQNYTLL